MVSKIRKPFIGISTYCETKPKKIYSSVSYNYVYSVLMAGGIPILIPVINSKEDLKSYAEKIDGLLLTGGEDVSPLTYGENPIKEVTQISTDRDEQEIELFMEVLKRDIPVLGICRGIQIMNVAFGGTLYQDIHVQRKNSFGHCPMETPVNNLYHSIKINRNSKLYEIFGKDDMCVNSFHHQAIKELSEEFIISAMSEDGIIEAVENPKKGFALGIQFHPEDLTAKYPVFLKLFDAFTTASSNRISKV